MKHHDMWQLLREKLSILEKEYAELDSRMGEVWSCRQLMTIQAIIKLMKDIENGEF